MPAAAVTPDGAGITYSDSINVALAVAMPDGGLITPVLKVGASTKVCILYTVDLLWVLLCSVERGQHRHLPAVPELGRLGQACPCQAARSR